MFLVSHMTCIWITDFENKMKAMGFLLPQKATCVCLIAQLCLTFCTPWSVGRQAPPSMGFSGQEYWSGLPFSTPGDLLDLGIKPASLASPALAGRFFTTSITWDAHSSKEQARFICSTVVSIWLPSSSGVLQIVPL